MTSKTDDKSNNHHAMLFPFSRVAVIPNDSTQGQTYQMTREVPCAFDQVQVVYAEARTTGKPAIISASAAVAPNLSDPNINGAKSWSSLFSWPTSQGDRYDGTPPLSTTHEAPAYFVSEPLDIHSLPRDDNRPGAVLSIRLFVHGGTTECTVAGNGRNDILTNWATRPAGNRRIMRMMTGNYLNSDASFSSTTNISQTPIFGLILLSRQRVVNVVRVGGDSNLDGRGTYIGAGYVLPACEELTTETGIPVCDSNFAVAGSPTSSIRSVAKEVLSKFGSYINVGIFTASTTNDLPKDSRFTEAITDAEKTRATEIAEVARAVHVPLAAVLCGPVNPSVRDLNETDSIRIAGNQTLTSSLTELGVTVIDTVTPINGVKDADGQIWMKEGLTTDNIHHNDVGNAILVPPVKAAIRRLAGI